MSWAWTGATFPDSGPSAPANARTFHRAAQWRQGDSGVKAGFVAAGRAFWMGDRIAEKK
jgi:hypothetical protein